MIIKQTPSLNMEIRQTISQRINFRAKNVARKSQSDDT